MKSILVSAYGCEPDKGSEAGVGWQWILQMAKFAKLHVITRANNRESIEAALPNSSTRNIVFHYYDAPHFIKKFKKRAKGLYIYNLLWQLGTIPIIKKILREESIDYTHYLTFGSMWMPTVLPFFDTPFIWGPVGGGDCEPMTFAKVLPFKERVILLFRHILNWSSFCNPLVLLPAWRARIILCRTYNSSKIIPKCFADKIRIVQETGMELLEAKRYELERSCLKIITTGRLMYSKNIISAIHALALLPENVKYEYTVVGSGPAKSMLQEAAKKLGIDQRVIFVDEVTRAEVISMLRESDLFLFPSLREGASWSLMEAMSVGLPSICLNWAGMQVTTDDSCAVRLPVTDAKQMPHDIANAIKMFIENPSKLEIMGRAARERIKEHFAWNAKGDFMKKLLQEMDYD